MISKIHYYLLYPGDHEAKQPRLKELEVKDRSGKLYLMLKDIYDNSHNNCKIEISFNSTNQHKVREHILAYIENSCIENGRKIAKRLQSYTTRRSGPGLLFLITGSSGKSKKLIILRFPGKQGICVEEGNTVLAEEFLERIYMKSAHRYKAV